MKETDKILSLYWSVEIFRILKNLKISKILFVMIKIQKDDDVIFHIATDRRSLRERAVNIRMQEDAIRDDRERGKGQGPKARSEFFGISESEF